MLIFRETSWTSRGRFYGSAAIGSYGTSSTSRAGESPDQCREASAIFASLSLSSPSALGNRSTNVILSITL